MSHDHHQHSHAGHAHSHNSANNVRALWIAFLLNLTFTVIEIVGGFWTGSVAILADAIHDAGDSIGFGLAIFLQIQSGKGPSGGFSYGYKRLSLLSALASAVVLLVGSCLVIYSAVPRFWNPQPPHEMGMAILAIFGIVANGLAALLLKQGPTLNEKVLSWHLFEDVLGWAIVLLGALILMRFQWYWLDPLMAIGLSLFISYNVFRYLWQTVLLFLQHEPANVDVARIKQTVLSVPGVLKLHDFHVWSLDGHSHVLSLHVVSADKGPPAREIRSQIRSVVKSLGQFHLTVEVESAQDSCEDDCQSDQ